MINWKDVYDCRGICRYANEKIRKQERVIPLDASPSIYDTDYNCIYGLKCPVAGILKYLKNLERQGIVEHIRIRGLNIQSE